MEFVWFCQPRAILQPICSRAQPGRGLYSPFVLGLHSPTRAIQPGLKYSPFVLGLHSPTRALQPRLGPYSPFVLRLHSPARAVQPGLGLYSPFV